MSSMREPCRDTFRNLEHAKQTTQTTSQRQITKHKVHNATNKLSTARKQQKKTYTSNAAQHKSNYKKTGTITTRNTHREKKCNHQQNTHTYTKAQSQTQQQTNTAHTQTQRTRRKSNHKHNTHTHTQTQAHHKNTSKHNDSHKQAGATNNHKQVSKHQETPIAQIQPIADGLILTHTHLAGHANAQIGLPVRPACRKVRASTLDGAVLLVPKAHLGGIACSGSPSRCSKESPEGHQNRKEEKSGNRSAQVFPKFAH